MYLLYVDESGLPTGKHDDHFVLAGLALHEEDCYPLARILDATQRRVLPGPNGSLELHASRIISGREEWSHVSKTDRIKVLDRSFLLLKDWVAPSGRQPTYFAVVISKHSISGKSVVQVAYDQLLARFDSFLTRLHLSGDSHRSLVIADESSYEKLVQQIMPKWKDGTAGVKKLHGLVEVPLFADSKASRLIQAVDLIAWATFNYYERGHTNYFSKIHRRFDSQDGIQHGLCHMVRGYLQCGCAACESRQLHAVPARPKPWAKVARP